MMHRTQILLPKPVIDWLREQAEREGTSVSEVIRAIIKEHRKGENE